MEFVNEVIFILRSIKDPQGDTKCEFLLPDNTSMFHFYYFLNSIKPLNIYLNKSLYYSNDLYSLFPPLGFVSNYRIMLGDIKIWGQGLVRAVLAV